MYDFAESKICERRHRDDKPIIISTRNDEVFVKDAGDQCYFITCIFVLPEPKLSVNVKERVFNKSKDQSEK
ncbi:hypothetical protein CS022_01200 [Veronia nyctiphanis]|uniref:Uncharacterized protein n=1 Tax=Veronia nyctiphanis TaxID=1278244 RepID=A0A4Q0YX32_9GAMM|nr:hypothetical protein CS022_01200 [Veronia nyctiphanis]